MVGNRSLFSKKMFHNRVIMMLMRFHEIFLNKKKITCDVMALWLRTMQFHEMFIFFFDYWKTKITFGLCWSEREFRMFVMIFRRCPDVPLLVGGFLNCLSINQYEDVFTSFLLFFFFSITLFRKFSWWIFRYHQRVSKINKYISKAEAAKRRARAFIPWSFDSIFF